MRKPLFALALAALWGGPAGSAPAPRPRPLTEDALLGHWDYDWGGGRCRVTLGRGGAYRDRRVDPDPDGAHLEYAGTWHLDREGVAGRAANPRYENPTPFDFRIDPARLTNRAPLEAEK